MRFGGGIGEVLSNADPEDRGLFAARGIYDLGFFLIISVVLVNLVFGIILDTFSGKNRFPFYVLTVSFIHLFIHS